MALSIANKWIWDFWIVKENGKYHIFFLQADKSLGDPALRHWNVSIGHAVSTDLKHWTVLQDALWPSQSDTENDPADSYTTWTGSIIRKEKLWYLFYTGTRRSEDGKIQRVCLATSEDLVTWEKHNTNPIVQLDSRWYDGLDFDRWHDASWRDPWVMPEVNGEGYRMLVTCRVNTGSNDGRGVIGQAVSTDLMNWTVKPPFFAPGEYGEMEVPQIEKIGGRYYLFCTVSSRYCSQSHRETVKGPLKTGLRYYIADHFDGPYKAIGEGFLLADEAGSLYAARVIQGFDQQWSVMAFYDLDKNGDFVGGVSDPIAIEIRDDGQLCIEGSV